MKETSEYITMIRNLIKDCESKCSTTSCSRDIRTIISRVKHEGLSFLTITMPIFCDWFFLSLEKGIIDSNSFPGWKRNQCLPAFLSGFTSLVFDRGTGRRLNEQSIEAVHSVRQICYLFKKVEIACAEKRIEKSMSSFLQTDDEMSHFKFGDEDIYKFANIGHILVSEIVPNLIDECDLIPHHGPGATADRISGNRKNDSRFYCWFKQLDSSFSESLMNYSSEEMATNVVRNYEECSVVRVVHVPKTLKSPRIIAMEPVAMQMVQQSLKDFLVDAIENRSYLTSGHVNFTDQSINQELALNASKNKKLATIDLSEASDRVSNDLVKILFSTNPNFSRMIQACRSQFANVGGKIIKLNKFASMGSALCFPVESLVFYTICILGRAIARGFSFPLSRHEIFQLTRDIYIYGDDIIVPANEVETISNTLHRFYLRVNHTKSYSLSSFRESCGMDAFEGVKITPIYLRKPFSDGQVDQDLVSHVATGRQLFKAGYYRTYEFIRDRIHRQLGYVLPEVGDTSPGLGWELSQPGVKRFNKRLQRLEVKTLVPFTRFRKDRIDGVPALFKCLTLLERANKYKTSELKSFGTSTDNEHLKRSPVRGALTLKRRWVPIN